VLILYDAAGSFGWIGSLYAQQVANLMSHFDRGYVIRDVAQYQLHDMGNYSATFYIGTVYGNALPAAFLQDVLEGTDTVCWIGRNLWQVASDTTQEAFEDKYGFRFLALDTSGYAEVSYLNTIFTKELAEPEISLVQVLDPDIAETRAWCQRVSPASTVPYAVHAGNLWFFVDVPLSFTTLTDRYLVFCDLLHDVLGVDHAVSHRALIRIEDVSPATSPQSLRDIADYLSSEQVPFSVAVIPIYTDPLGAYNGGVPETALVSREAAFASALRYMTTKGGRIIMHGSTHQYGNRANPYNGVSGDDYEFYRVDLNQSGAPVFLGPVREDTTFWVHNRVAMGLTQFSRAALTPVAWETPHYLASPLDYRYFARKFPLATHINICFATSSVGTTHFQGQFFPYVIPSDIYGQKLAPENLGFVDPDAGGETPMLQRAQLNLTLRDAWASGYFHPYLDINYLKGLVTGLKGMGYEFVPLDAGME
jgi:uncharacterized protein YdaL